MYDQRPVDDLFTYFKDGTMLLVLLGRLFPEAQIPRYNETPTLRVQMLDNLSIALSIMEKLGIKVPFIKPTSTKKHFSHGKYYHFLCIIDGDLIMFWEN